MRGRSGSIAVIVLLATLGWTGASAEKLVVVRSGSTRSVPLERRHGFPAARAAALADALGYNWTAGGAMQMDGESVRFSPGSPFFSIGDDVYQLANPIYRHGAHLMLPASWALDWLPRLRPRRWRQLDGRLVERPHVASRPPARSSWLVVIDPGHGGEDPGTIGVGGTKEKDVALAIARRLAKRLKRERGVRVVLTRDRDTLVALSDRPRIPRLRSIDAPPDLFLSIHGNAMPKKPSATRGFETYFLQAAKTEEARRVALRENASLRFEGEVDIESLDDLQLILSDLQSTGNLTESRLFAASINRSLRATLHAPDLGVKQGPFTVLVGATMPAALVEVGYLSNRAEEKLLRSSSYQAKIADALADAVVNYLSEYGRRVWSSYDAGG